MPVFLSQTTIATVKLIFDTYDLSVGRKSLK
jgi:hypothetical protein